VGVTAHAYALLLRSLVNDAGTTQQE
jgi:hypothetical protein